MVTQQGFISSRRKRGGGQKGEIMLNYVKGLIIFGGALLFLCLVAHAVTNDWSFE